MKIEVTTVPPKPEEIEIESVSLVLDEGEALYLLGVVGAQTTEIAVDIYAPLREAIAKAKGHNQFNVSSDARSRKAFSDASNNRKWGELPVDKHIEFVYHGVVRTLVNPTIDSNARLLKGFEMTRGGSPTEQYKSYHLDDIGW